jgi:precorrin-4/cobalt-precorrin-4 C11-methyltransferase
VTIVRHGPTWTERLRVVTEAAVPVSAAAATPKSLSFGRTPVTVHFVGAGPGAADLITLRAATMLAAADLVLYPGTYLDADVLAHCRPDARLVDTQGLDLDAITAELVAAHRSGLDAVRLTSGDPSVYSALTEQTRRLDAAGVPWDVTPGVAAYAAAAARVGTELTVPLVAQSVVLTRVQARSTAMPDTESLAAFAATRATLVLHLAITRVRELMDGLVDEYGADCPVIVVHRASQPQELVLHGTVADIADQVEAAGLRQAAVILVGRALSREGSESYLYSSTRPRRE